MQEFDTDRVTRFHALVGDLRARRRPTSRAGTRKSRRGPRSIDGPRIPRITSKGEAERSGRLAVGFLDDRLARFAPERLVLTRLRCVHRQRAALRAFGLHEHARNDFASECVRIGRLHHLLQRFFAAFPAREFGDDFRCCRLRLQHAISFIK